MKKVVLVTGTGQISLAIIRRIDGRWLANKQLASTF